MTSEWFRVPGADYTDDSGDPVSVPYHHDQVDRYWGIVQEAAGNTGGQVWFVRYFAPDEVLERIAGERRSTVLTRGEVVSRMAQHLGRDVDADQVREIAQPEVTPDA